MGQAVSCDNGILEVLVTLMTATFLIQLPINTTGKAGGDPDGDVGSCLGPGSVPIIVVIWGAITEPFSLSLLSLSLSNTQTKL